MQFRPILTLTLGLLLALAQATSAQSLRSTASSRAEDALLDMSQAFKTADRKRLAALLPLTRGHPLEAWASYWELRARLDDAKPQEVQDFFRRYPNTYLEDRLRADWLLLLGAREDWAGFATEYTHYRMGDDRELRCYASLLEPWRSHAGSSDEVRRNWLALRDADKGCTTAAEVLLASKKLDPLEAWRKARLSIEANRPAAARGAVQLVAPESANAVTEINSNPARYLSARILAPGKARKELVVLALVKMATHDADATSAVLENKWSVHLSPEERNWAWGVIGKYAAQRLSANALDYFAKVGKDTDLSDDMLAWKARAALRAGRDPQWAKVLAAIMAMSDEARNDPTWIYWRARSLQARAMTEARKPNAAQAVKQGLDAELQLSVRLFESIASVNGFYQQLALEELGRKITLPPRPSALTAEEKEAARQNPGLQRALAAIAIGLRPEGVREWNYSTNLSNPRGTSGGMSERELLAAADLACQHQVWDRCINTSERTKIEVDFSQRFPLPHQDAVVKRAQQIGLDPAYVYGLIRQESRFITDARSHVGASGLMQVMPPTARWTAKKLGLTNFKPEHITDRDINIAIGTGYLKLVLDDFGGSLPMAAAAYNAGPSRPRSWRGQSGAPVLDAAIWAENVPFAETRDYVKKVLANTTNYAAIITGQPQSLQSRLGRVGPRDAAAGEANSDLP